MVKIRGVSLDLIVAVNAHTERFKSGLEFDSRGLISPTGEHNAAYHQSKSAESVDEAQNVEVVGDAKVTAHLILFNIRCVDDDNDLDLFLELCEHMHLTVGSKAGKYACGMEIIEELAAKLKIELAAKLIDTTTDVRRL